MKKIGFFLLIAVFVFTLSAVAFADGVKVSLTSGTAMQGEDIVVKLNIDENPGFIATVITVDYDSEVLTLKSVKDMKLLGENNHSDNLSDDKYFLSWFNPLSLEDYDAEGSVAELTFAVNENAPGGSYDVNVDVVEMYNTNLQAVAVSEEISSTVNVMEVHYETTDEGAKFTGISGPVTGKFEIPGTLGGKPVTEIGDSAFANCTEVTEFVLPESITHIGERAFAGCTKLTSLEIPDTVRHIGAGILEDSGYYIDESNWEDGMLYIGKHLLDAKDSLEGSCSVKEGTLTIAEGTFSCCNGITDFELPESIVYIGADAFYDTAYFNEEGNWDDGVLYVGKNAVSVKTSVEGRFVIKEGTLLIAEACFSGCDKITDIYIPVSVANICDGAFCGTDALDKVRFEGSKADWNKITIGEKNSGLSDAEIIYGVEYIPGDVNGDGEVTRNDLLRLAKHFSGFTVEIDEAAADVTGDGEVTRSDLLRLAKYFSGFDVNLGE